MTDKQNIFVQEYLTCLNATEAAKKAGYSENTAYSIGQRLLKDEAVQEAIRAGMNRRTERTELTQDYVLHNIKEIAERCMQKKPVIVKGEQATDEDGNHLWTFDAKNAIRALELLGKHMNMFNDSKKDKEQEVLSQKYIFQWAVREELLKQEQEKEQAKTE